MIRNQVYFREDQDKELRLMTAIGDRTFSELVREGVDIMIKTRKNKKTIKFDALKDFAGLFKGGPKDLSKNMDYYLYDEPYQNK
ncbi:hypothetical protein ISR94_02550 [Candidatus Microgenomates bacterium]|nr:hypothetical protein [Candidatus Microgenomates bacterium]